MLSWCLQDWQLKLSGIDIATEVNGDTTEETDLDSDSPRSPVGAMNPLMLQFPQGQQLARDHASV